MPTRAVTSFRHQFLERIRAFWPDGRPHYRQQLLGHLGHLFDRFVEAGLADPTFGKELVEGDYFQQRLAEMLLAEHLWSLGFELSSASAGPDYFATKDGMSAWIELITPQPTGINPGWLASPQVGVWQYPHKEIALRYTAAIKEKHAKLVGTRGGGGYLASGLVKPDQPYIIAVNQHLLQRAFRTLNGISQIPAACEVLFAVGPQQLHLNRDTLAVVHHDHAHRPSLAKSANVGVPADSFFNPGYAPVSAVLAVDLVLEKFVTADLDHHLMQDHLSAVAYNPLANNPVKPRWIPADSHWTAQMAPGGIEVLSVWSIARFTSQPTDTARSRSIWSCISSTNGQRFIS